MQVVEKSTYRHVTTGKLENLLQAIQAAHQRAMVEHIGLDPQSQVRINIVG